MTSSHNGFSKENGQNSVTFQCPSSCYWGHEQVLISLKAFSVALNWIVLEVRSGHSFSFVLGLCIKGQKRGQEYFPVVLVCVCIKPWGFDYWHLLLEKKKKRKKKDSKAGWIPKHQLRNIGHVGNETGCAVVRLNTWKCNDFATSSSIAVCGGSIRTSKAIDATIQKQFLSDLERIWWWERFKLPLRSLPCHVLCEQRPKSLWFCKFQLPCWRTHWSTGSVLGRSFSLLAQVPGTH